jgi:membrane protein implicated in regulation of membrane protease activity
MEWWAWLIAGFVLLVAELVTPGGFVTLFFGVGAMLVALLVALGLGGPAWLQFVLFAVFSVILLAALRKFLQQQLGTGRTRKVDSLVGETAVLLEDLTQGKVGKAELRGTPWNVQTKSWDTLKRGDRCIVEQVDGLTLWVAPRKD